MVFLRSFFFKKDISSGDGLETAVRLDQVGLSLSFLCALHCALTPFILFIFPLFAQSYLQSQWVHILLGVFVIPVAILAMWAGFRHHRRKIVFALVFPGLALISALSFGAAQFLTPLTESVLMILASAILISAHLLNRKFCACEHHDHESH